MKNVAEKILRLMNETVGGTVAAGQRNLKRANELLEDNDMTWGDIIAVKTSDKPELVKSAKTVYPGIEEMFEEIFNADLKPEATDFVARLRDGYEQFGRLTDSQLESLEENYERLILKPRQRAIKFSKRG